MDHIDIKTLRCNIGLSQAKFAQEIGVTRETVSFWERGLRNPSDLSYAKIKQLADQKKPKKRHQNAI